MATLLGQLLLVLSVALVVVAEHKEFGCKFDDEHYNYHDKEDYGDFVKTMKFKNTTEFKKFMNDLEQIRKTIRYNSFYNTLVPFIKMYEDYKDAKKRNPASTFTDFFPKYNPTNPYDDAQRSPNNTIFSVISIYSKMKTEFGNKYPAFKDSFVLATCDEDVEKAVLEKVNLGIDQNQTPPGFEHDRIVGVIPFLILKDGQLSKVRGFVIVESTHVTSSMTLAPIVMDIKNANHTLNKNEVQLFGPTVARYTWLPKTLYSYIRLDSVIYNMVTSRLENGKLVTVPKEEIISTDLLFMTPRSLCPFVNHVWKNNFMKRYVHLLQDTLEKKVSTQHYIGFELKPLSKNDTLFTYIRFRENLSTEPTMEEFRLDGFGLDGLKRMNQTYKNSLKSFATIFNVEYTELYKLLQQMYNIEHTDNAFMRELVNYRPQVSSTSFRNVVSGNLFEKTRKLLLGKLLH